MLAPSLPVRLVAALSPLRRAAVTGALGLGLLASPLPAVALDKVDEQAILLIEAQRLPPAALERYVRTEDPTARARAAIALGRLRNPSAIDALATLARDPEPAVRAEAIHALGQTPETERALLALVHVEPDPSVRPLVLEALGKQADVAGLRALVDALQQDVGFLETPDEARAAALALGRVALRDREALTRSDIVGDIASQLRRFDRDTRRAAAFALARIRPERVDHDLARFLVERAGAEPDPVTQAFLVRAVASLAGVEEERTAVYEQTVRDPAPGVRIATARAATVTGWTGVAVLLADRNTSVRHQAIEAVGAIDSLDRTAVLLPILSAGDTLEAAEDLQLTRDPRLLDAVVTLRTLARHDLLPDPTPWVDPSRPTAIRAAALSALTDQSALATLALDDAEAPVRSAATIRLVELEPDLATLLPLLSATDAMVAAIAAEAIGTKPDADAQSPLLTTLTDALDADLLAHGLGALAGLYDADPPVVKKVPTDAIELARTHATHGHTKVREAARRILDAAGKDAPPAWHRLVTVPYDDVMDVTSARVQTDRGEFVIDLVPELAPITVWNFVQLAGEGWFDGVTWHRVVPDFVAQTGDPRGDGTGGPAWTVPDEINRLSYDTGVVGMAHAGPETAGSQWFVTLSPQPHLDGGYTAFGKVTQGLHVVKELQPSDRIRAVHIERRSDR